ncbi:CU044_5270 family protein [Actinoallomurus soli]|uniref:CU044_5270 family protein n=1 Tax=Actinoallomurus soli TaxID=2952535 RepID=UPI0020920218|nr:CU044_5270 family protein [Actinoallomurus soli]MCO5970439.1 CU044_5270 family protein [Actinoallomurus soli]
MDELQAVRELFPETPPPAARVTARARRRATGAAGRRLPRLRWALPGLGLVAAATAVALAVGSAGSAGDGPKRPVPTSSLPLDGRAVFLAAAEQAERQPMGGYWYCDQISGQSYLLKAGYAVIGAHLETFEWTGAAKGSGGRFYGRDLPARPATPEDEAVWERAGAPTSFRVMSNGHPMTYTRKAGRWEEDKGGQHSGGRFFLMGFGKELTTQEVLALPTDSRTLAKRFLSPPSPRRPGAKRGPAPVSNAYKLLRAADLLTSAPLPPKVGAGLMRALVAQPGVHTIATASDALGRQGVALAVDQPSWGWDLRPDGTFVRKDNGYRTQEQLIFDKKTGALLAEQSVLLTPGGEYRSRKPGFVIDYWLIRSYGWTDRRPSPPPALPFR